MNAQVETTFSPRGGLRSGQLRRFLVLGCGLVLAGTIAPLPMLPAQASDLNRQLTVPLNNGTRGSARDRADRLLQYGKTLEMDNILVGAIQAWRQALQIYQDIGDREAASLTYGYLATAYGRIGQAQGVEDSLRRRLALTRGQQDFIGQVYALNNLGRTLMQNGGTEAAESLFTEAIELSSRIGSLKGQAISHDSMGVLAVNQGDLSRAMTEFEHSLYASRRAADSRTETTTLNNMGDVYRRAGRYPESLKYYALAEKLADINTDRPNHYRAIDGMVVALNQQQMYQQSAVMLTRRLNIAQEQENLAQQLRSLSDLAQVQRQMGNIPQARQFYQQAIDVAQILQDPNQESLLIERMVSLTDDDKQR